MSTNPSSDKRPLGPFAIVILVLLGLAALVIFLKLLPYLILSAVFFGLMLGVTFLAHKKWHLDGALCTLYGAVGIIFCTVISLAAVGFWRTLIMMSGALLGLATFNSALREPSRMA